MKNNTKTIKKIRRHARIRAIVKGTKQRPRLSVFRSLTKLNIQLIDDNEGKTLACVNDKNTDIKKGDVGERKGKIAQSYLLGRALAEKAKELKITEVVFDRGGNLYHGRVAAVAEGARDGGLKF
ncbi:MAG: 50S ribosomal protein L18 [Patescibacteria group bacterium]